MITLELQEDRYTANRQLFELANYRGGFVHDKTGQRIALCHCFPTGKMITPSGLCNSDVIICCYPQTAKKSLPCNKVLGNWNNETICRVRYDYEKKCTVLYIWEKGTPEPQENYER